MKNDIKTGQSDEKEQVISPTSRPILASELLIQGLQNNTTRRDLTYDIQAEKLNTLEVVSIKENTYNNKKIIYLTTEPTMMKKLGKESRLTSEEYVKAIHRFLQEEESEWDDQTMQDMMSSTNEYIMAETMIKYATNKKDLKIDEGMDSNYSIQRQKRYGEGKKFLGEALIVTLISPVGL